MCEFFECENKTKTFETDKFVIISLSQREVCSIENKKGIRVNRPESGMLFILYISTEIENKLLIK